MAGSVNEFGQAVCECRGTRSPPDVIDASRRQRALKMLVTRMTSVHGGDRGKRCFGSANLSAVAASAGRIDTRSLQFDCSLIGVAFTIERGCACATFR